MFFRLILSRSDLTGYIKLWIPAFAGMTVESLLFMERPDNNDKK